MDQSKLFSILHISVTKLAETLHSKIDHLHDKNLLTKGEAKDMHDEIEEVMDSILWENKGKISMGLIDSLNNQVAKNGGSFL